MRSLPVALALIGGGAVYFGAELGFLDGRRGEQALTAIALVVLVYLMFTVEAAWILTAGIVSTMFAANWANLGMNSSVGPHRVLMGAGIVACLLRLGPNRDRPELRLGVVHFVLGAAIAYAFVSAIFVDSLDQENGRFVLIDQFGILPFLIFTIVPIAFHERRQRMILLGALVGAGLYLSVTAILEKLNLDALIWPSYITDPGVGIHPDRSRGPFVEAAANGLALFGCTVAAAVAFTVWREGWQRTVAASVVALGPVAILLTVTRSVWVAGVIGVAVVFLTTAGLRRYLLPVAAAGTAAVLLSLALIPGLSGQVEERQNDEGPVHERRNTNAAGLRMIADKPFFGFGWDMPYLKLEPYFRQHPDIPLIGAKAGLHNSYLQYAAALGLVGFGIWAVGMLMAFLGALVGEGALRGRAPPDVRGWQAGLKAVAIAWAIIGAFSPAHYVFTTYLVFVWAGIASVRTAPAALPAFGTLSPNGSRNGRNGHMPARPQPQLG